MSHKGRLIYQKLCARVRKGAALQSISSLLDWDQETMMPSDGIGIRSEQFALISTWLHKEKTSRAFSSLLSELIDLKTQEIKHPDLSPEEIAAIHRWQRDYIHEDKLPASFVKKFAETTVRASHIWAEARAENSFKLFKPHLEKIVDLCRKKADLLGFDSHPYDPLLDIYEPEMTTERLIPLFARLKTALTPIIQTIASQPGPDTSFLKQTFAADKQMDFGHKILKILGFDTAKTRLDLSAHPFCCSIHSSDLRMTTHIHPNNVCSSLFSVLHEAGHGLYAQARPVELWGTPLGESCSLGIDESQSRFLETTIGKSFSFWKYLFPELQKEFPGQLSGIDAEQFFRAINEVKPGPIRIESDEICYGLHIILRFEMEKALIEGSLKVKDVPEAWDAKMVEYLGVKPKNFAEGCLQDIHWSTGGFGYFPTYMLGNLYAAQFYQSLHKEFPQIEHEISQGNLKNMLDWLKKNIHSHGRRYNPDELIKKVTGKPLSEAPFLAYIQHKFGQIYKLS